MTAWKTDYNWKMNLYMFKFLWFVSFLWLSNLQYLCRWVKDGSFNSASSKHMAILSEAQGLQTVLVWVE